MNWNDSLSYVASSDIGMRRLINQDAHGVALATDYDEWRERGHLLVVADGMGAHAAGELASRLAVNHVIHNYRKRNDAKSPPESLATAIHKTNDEINRKGEANLDFYNMGTTCSALLLLPQGAVVGHVGDSRVYRLRGRDLVQLTFDHSLVWEMKEAGQVSESDITQIPKNVITRSLGPHRSVAVDMEGPFPTAVGDTFLLCSDGLTGRVEDFEIASALAYLPLEQANKLLVSLANLRGGADNITVVTAKVCGDDMATERMSPSPPPLAIGRAVEEGPLHPAWWVCLGVVGLAVGAFAAANHVIAACIAAIVFVLFLLVMMIRLLTQKKSVEVRLVGKKKLGKGPYRSSKAQSEEEFARDMILSVQLGRQVATSKGLTADWSNFDRNFEQASQLADDGQFGPALASLTEASDELASVFQSVARAVQ